MSRRIVVLLYSRQVMLCDPTVLQCQDGYLCDGKRLNAKVGNDKELKQEKMKSGNRFTFFFVPKNTARLGFDEMYAADATLTLFQGAQPICRWDNSLDKTIADRVDQELIKANQLAKEKLYVDGITDLERRRIVFHAAKRFPHLNMVPGMYNLIRFNKVMLDPQVREWAERFRQMPTEAEAVIPPAAVSSSEPLVKGPDEI